MRYTVKNVKFFIGNEGHGFNASLYRDDNKVCLVIDDASGGDYQYQWVDWKANKVEVKGANFSGDVYSYQGTPEEAMLHKFVSKLPWEQEEFMDRPHPITPDDFVCKLVTEYEKAISFKKACKKGLCIQVGDQIGTNEYIIFKGINSKDERIPGILKQRYPKQKVVILNEVYGVN